MLDHKKVYCDTNNTDQKKRKFTFSAVVLREDRSFEFYSDFNMVSSSKKGESIVTAKGKKETVEYECQQL
jgi:hypothetical protein